MPRPAPRRALVAGACAAALAATAASPAAGSPTSAPSPERLLEVFGELAGPLVLERLDVDAPEAALGELAAPEQSRSSDEQDAGPMRTSTAACLYGGVGLVDRAVVTWPPADPATVSAVEVLRYTPTGSASVVATLPVTATQWADHTDHGGTTYDVRFRLRSGGSTVQDCPTGASSGLEDMVYTAYDGGAGPLYSLRQGSVADESSASLDAAGDALDVAYSPDGTRVVYSALAPDNDSLELYVRLANGTGSPVRLTASADADELEPAWSPDGRRLLVTQVDDAGIRLVTVDVLTKAVAPVAGGDWAADGDWTPTGNAVVAADLQREDSGLVRITVPGGSRTELAGTSGGYSPAISPDGNRLAFVRQDEVGEDVVDRLLLVASGGGTPTAVTSSVTDLVLSPVWGPTDGRLWWLQLGETGATTSSATATGVDVRSERSAMDGADAWSFDMRRSFDPLTSHFVRTRWNDVIARDASGTLYAYAKDYNEPWAAPKWFPRTTVGTGWNSMTAILAAGDVTGDQQADLVSRDKDGRLWVYPGNGNVTGPASWGARRQLGSGWNAMTMIIPVGDKDGDGRADLVARDRDGRLWLYAGNGAGGFGARRQIGNGWNAMTAITATADVTYDRLGDLVARDTSGRLWLYPSAAGGGFGARRLVGSGWNGMTAIVGVDSYDGGNKAILARDTSGRLWSYLWVNNTWPTPMTLQGWGQVGSGWNGFTVITG